jgi:poly-gamma-glutamate synthesis protein (capsule biosynthesis protein)
MRRTGSWLALGVLAVFGAAAGAQDAQKRFDPKRPPDRELAMTTNDPFTLAAVGDCIISHPLAPLLPFEPEFAAVVNTVRAADAAFGNFENTAIDWRGFTGFPHRTPGDWALVAEPEVARDLKELGFDLLSRANNHSLDWGIEGMRESSRHLDEAGLVHAGVGENRAQARAARYLETPRGRIALVSMASTFRESADALPPFGHSPGRPGLSPVRTTRTTLVPPEIFRELVKVRNRMEAARDESVRRDASDESSTLSLFGETFEAGDRLASRYQIHPVDQEEILQAIRLGKQNADFLVATIHAHERDVGTGAPGDFLPALARAAVDAGADAFIGHGVHVLGPIEIYKGRPIFYSLANFFWSDIQEPMPRDHYEENWDLLTEVFGDPEKATNADLAALLNARGFNDDLVFQSVVAVSRFENGGLAELRLYPVDLGYGRTLTKSGIPREASAEMSRAILERLARISQTYGTAISIERNVGVIRPARQ